MAGKVAICKTTSGAAVEVNESDLKKWNSLGETLKAFSAKSRIAREKATRDAGDDLKQWFCAHYTEIKTDLQAADEILKLIPGISTEADAVITGIEDILQLLQSQVCPQQAR